MKCYFYPSKMSHVTHQVAVTVYEVGKCYLLLMCSRNRIWPRKYWVTVDNSWAATSSTPALYFVCFTIQCCWMSQPPANTNDNDKGSSYKNLISSLVRRMEYLVVSRDVLKFRSRILLLSKNMSESKKSSISLSKTIHVATTRIMLSHPIQRELNPKSASWNTARRKGLKAIHQCTIKYQRHFFSEGLRFTWCVFSVKPFSLRLSQ